MPAYEFPDKLKDRVAGELPKLIKKMFADPTADISIKIFQPNSTKLKQDLREHASDLLAWHKAWARFESSGGTLIRGKVIKTNFASLQPAKSVVFGGIQCLGSFFGRKIPAEIEKTLTRLTDLAFLGPSEDASSSFPLTSDVEAIRTLSENDYVILRSYFQWRIRNLQYAGSIRNIPVPGMHTKFIEQNRALILSISRYMGLLRQSEGGLPARLGFQEYDGRTLWIKLPDSMSPSFISGKEIAVRPSELQQGSITRVVIVENIQNFRETDPSEGVCIFWGNGNEVSSLIGDIQWLHDVDVYYFGDCDSYGFKILGNCRRIFSSIKSVMMDVDTISKNMDSAVEEPQSSHIDVLPENLDEAEREAVIYLKEHYGRPMRLEQEKISNRIGILADHGLCLPP